MKKNHYLLSTILCLSLTACGGDDEGGIPDATSSVDASTGADAASQDAAPMSATAFVLGTDYQSSTGVASAIEVSTLEVTQNVAGGVAGSDPVVRRYDDKLYIVNRDTGNNVTILRSDNYSLIAQIATGNNPQDVAVVGTKLYVPVYGGTGVDVLDESMPSSGAVDTIDLSGLDPTDDQPNCNSALAVGTKVLVTCQILDAGYAAQGKGKLVVIDSSDNTVSEPIDLNNENPVGYLQQTPAEGMLGGDVLVSTVGSYGSLDDGCLERISASATVTVETCVVDEASVGGSIGAYRYVPQTDSIWISYSDSSFQGYVIEYSVADSALASEPLTPDTQSITDLAVCPDGHVLLADGSVGATGIRVYSADGTEVTTAPLDIGAPTVYQQGLSCF